MTEPRHYIASVWHRPISTVGITLFFFFLSLGLILEPFRWSATPAYGNLLDVLAAITWGFLFLIDSLLLGLALVLGSKGGRPVSILAHIGAFILTVAWTLSFIIRWWTDPKTTVMNFLTWGILLLGMVVRSYIVMDDYTEKRRPITTQVIP